LAITLEQAGFEIRDQIMWIYSSGFPKSQDVGKSIQRSLGVKEYEQVAVDTTKNSGFGMTDHARVRAGEDWSTPAATVKKVIATDPAAKQWSGWGTALKPAHEPIALARKPLSRDNSIARNCQQWGTGALNIDATRVGDEIFDTSQNRRTTQDDQLYDGGWSGKEGGELVKGRFPSNVIGDIAEPYQKYFYSPKVSRRERHVGFEQQPSTKQLLDSVGGYFCDTQGNAIEKTDDRVTMCYVPGKGVIFIHGLMEALKELGRNLDGNNHPTVKPIELMKYLIKLITPPGGHVLDPFNGSGSTGMAAVELDYDYTGIELDPAYVEIARRRIAAWYATTHPLEATGLFE
jgi:site-specific DNA-methyltransferase (adenine-specific)